MFKKGIYNLFFFLGRKGKNSGKTKKALTKFFFPYAYDYEEQEQIVLHSGNHAYLILPCQFLTVLCKKLEHVRTR